MAILQSRNGVEHEIFRQFRQHLPLTPCTYVKSIMEVKNDLLYMVEESTGNIVVTRSSSFVHAGVAPTYQVNK